MSAIAAIFRTTKEADEAVSELRLRGIEKIYEGPCESLDQPSPGATAAQEEGKPRVIIALGQSYGGDPGSIAAWGREMITTGGAGWSLFESLNLDAQKRRLWAERDCTLVVVEAGENAAVVRTILETNGAEELHDGV